MDITEEAEALLYEELGELYRIADQHLANNEMTRHVIAGRMYHAKAQEIADKTGYDPRVGVQC